MARETNKQRRERFEQEALQADENRLKEAIETWTFRLMQNLERVTNLNGDIRVRDALFNIRIMDNYVDAKYFSIPIVVQDLKTVSDMEDFEFELNMAEHRLAERKRLEQLRANALSKLTKEEKEALGI